MPVYCITLYTLHSLLYGYVSGKQFVWLAHSHNIQNQFQIQFIEKDNIYFIEG